MQIKVVIDIQENSYDLIPDKYLPADVIIFRCNDEFISVDQFIGIIKQNIEKGEFHVFEKKG